MVTPESITYCAETVDVSLQQATAVLNLLVVEQATIPFITRYRKEATGNLDEVKIIAIESTYQNFLEREKRRSYILEALQKMEVLTPELESLIKRAQTLNELEDIYAPYKSKKKTKAMVAREKGLAPLAELILTTPKTLLMLEGEFTPTELVATFAEALEGALDIITEQMAHHPDLKATLRDVYWQEAMLVSEVKSKAKEEVEDASKYLDFFEFKEPVKSLRRPEAGHRYLAMRRGMMAKVLKVEVAFDQEHALSYFQNTFYPPAQKLGCREQLQKCASRAFQLFVHSSLDLEIKSELKQLADESAINVFAVNLRNLLLSPYLGAKVVMGVDPGIRTGCKIAVVDNSGKFLEDFVIYPHPPKEEKEKSRKVMEALIQKYSIEYIAIGNGTYGRETLAFFEEDVAQVRDGVTKATMISEAGASVYSASAIAREEFPDKDATVRGAISIARRFQDPLAELVKIDPKSIGVGQYQHDVNESKLKKSLDQVVESCVNFVGVDLNTASAPLLAHVSGIGPKVAQNVVKYREEKGRFIRREQLLEVSRFSQKVFEQAAGFLRIYEGENPLDSTFIHPERYGALMGWAQKKSYPLMSLVKEADVISELSGDLELSQSVGTLTFTDIITSLKTPIQDPRKIFKSVEFSKQLKGFGDVKDGEWYTGIVTNITRFGAFVDIGIKENGLVHISELSDKYIENALDQVKVGQELRVRVIGLDHERRRIAMSCRQKEGAKGGGFVGRVEEGSSVSIPGSNASQTKKIERQNKNNNRGENFRNSAFGTLKNWKS